MTYAKKAILGLIACTLALATQPIIPPHHSEAATRWNVSLWGKRRAFTEHIEKLAELVSQKTDGDFTLNLSYGGLSKNRENLDGISIGAFEMAQFCAGYHPDKNPSITVLELPFLGVDTLDKEMHVSMAIYNHPAVKKDMARWNATLLMPSPLPQYNIAGVGRSPDTIAQFAGMSVRATGGIGRALKELDAVPTSMSASEVRNAMDQGVIKASAFAPHAHISFGVSEVAKWWTTNLNPGTVNCPVVVNTDALNSLSDVHKEALFSSISISLRHYINNYNTKTTQRWQQILIDHKIKAITYDKKSLDDLNKKVAQSAAQEWVETNRRRGLPAQDLYDFMVGIIDIERE